MSYFLKKYLLLWFVLISIRAEEKRIQCNWKWSSNIFFSKPCNSSGLLWLEMLGDSTVRQDVNWYHDADTIYCSAWNKFTQAAPPLAMCTQLKAACQRSELFHTMLIPSVQHARLGGDRRHLGWKHGVNTVISSQHGPVLTFGWQSTSSMKTCQVFLQLLCFF